MATPAEFLDQDGNWVCTQCGACCISAPVIFHDVPELAAFDRGDGGCRHLKDDLSCGIYDTRPTACRTKGTASAESQAYACAYLLTRMENQKLAGELTPDGKAVAPK